MSLDDIKEINWRHFNLSDIPRYLLIGFGVVILGIIFLLLGFLL